MKKSTLAILIAVVAILTIGGIILASSGNDSDQTDTTTETQTIPTNSLGSDSTNNTDTNNTAGTTPDDNQTAASEIEIENFAFTPNNITVKKGTTVTWTNKDSTRHDVTPDEKTAEFKASELLDKDESYSVTFNTSGTYTYFCSLHPYMKGTVTVTE